MGASSGFTEQARDLYTRTEVQNAQNSEPVHLTLLRPKQCAQEHTLGVEGSNLINNFSSAHHHLQPYLDTLHRAPESQFSAAPTRRPMVRQW
jgi:hypothetical protein